MTEEKDEEPGCVGSVIEFDERDSKDSDLGKDRRLAKNSPSFVHMQTAQ